MSMTAEQTAELEAAEPNASDAEQIHDDTTPASGEQPTETPAEGSVPASDDTNEAEGQKPEGEKPEAEKTPEQQRAWRAVEAAKREQIKIAKAREGVERDKIRVQQYEERVTAHFQQRTRDLEARESRVKPLEAALERRDLAGLTALGFDFAAFAREAMEANTPEGIAKRALARSEQLEKERKQEREQQAQRERQQQQIEQTRRDAQHLVRCVEAEPDACPELYAWEPERVAHEGISIRDAFFRRDGRWPTAGQIIAVLEKRARDEAAVQQKRMTTLQQKRSANTSDAGSAGKADPNRASAGGKPPALTSSTANERAPSPPRELTEEEKDALCLADLRKLRAGR